jgi:pimeloyl-ACP methyl ester carboxylesterase
MQMTVNDVTIGYTDEGRGVPLLFVHGFPLSRGAWQKQIDTLRSSHRTIAPDLRGFGESETGTGPVTMAQYAEDLHALVQQLKTGPVVLIGHSMGGYVSFAFLRQYPEMVRGLILVGTKSGNDTPEAAAGRRATAEKVQAKGIEVVIEAMAPKMLAADNHDRAMAEEVRGFMTPSKPAGVIGALLGMAERPDATAELARISVPTLVVSGADDTLIPPTESEKLAQVIPGSQLNIIPQAGHLVAFEQPEKFNHVLEEWLDRAAFVVPVRELR